MSSYEATPNHACYAPTALVGVAIDTTWVDDPNNPNRRALSLWQGHARYCRVEAGRATRHDECAFGSASLWWAWLYGHMIAGRSVWLWAHRAGEVLTCLRLWEQVEAGNLTFTQQRFGKGEDGKPTTYTWQGAAIIEDPPTVLVMRHRSGTILTCVDVQQWLPGSLADLYEKLGWPARPALGDEASNAARANLCLHDSNALIQAALSIGQFVRLERCGRHRQTAAGQALHLWRHRCLPAKGRLHWGHTQEQKAEERLSYWGATRRCYFRGLVCRAGEADRQREHTDDASAPALEGAPVHHLDMTAAYGWAMHGHDFPTKRLAQYQDVPVEVAQRMLGGACAYACCDIDSPVEPWPVRRRDQTWWVTGQCQTWLCGPELARALASGVVQRVVKIVLYRAGRPFDPYVEACWEARQRAQATGDALGGALSKLLLAALHGRLSARRQRWKDLPGVVAPVLWGSYYEQRADELVPRTRRVIGGLVQELQPPQESRVGFPLVGAYVAAYGRERMRELRERALPENVLYIDTDSIHVTAAGYLRLALSGVCREQMMGYLHSAGTYDTVRYYGVADYCADGCRQPQWLGQDAVPVGPETYRVEAHGRLPGLLQGQAPGDATVTSRLVTVHREHPRGRYGPDGWWTPLDSGNAGG